SRWPWRAAGSTSGAAPAGAASRRPSAGRSRPVYTERARGAARFRTGSDPGGSSPKDPSQVPRLFLSGRPGELGRREPGLPLVGDAEGVNARPLRLRHREVRAAGVEHAVEADRPAGVDAEGDDVLDLEVDAAADTDAVAQSVVLDLDRHALDAEHLADEGAERPHRAAELAAEDA